MKSLQEVENKVGKVTRLIKADKQTQIRLNANGGNAVLLVCSPEEEKQYIDVLRKVTENKEYELIDINELLIEFIKDNEAEVLEKFDILRSSIHQIFKSPNGEDENDLYKLILLNIKNAFSEDKIPVLFNTGTLYGTGIDNIHIMESEIVMKANSPIVILYPAKKQGEKLLFLGSRPASKYRCMIID